MKKKSLKRILSITMSLAFCIGMMSGCGKPKSNDPNESNAAGTNEPSEQVTLKFIHKFPEDDRMKCFKEIVSSFEEKHSNIKIEMTAYGDEEIKDKTRVLLGSDKAPDIFFTWTGERIQQYVDTGTAMDISKYLNDDPEWKNSFNQAMLECNNKDGSYWGVPFDYSSKEFVYNKAIFDENNIKIPTTWNDFLDVCETLKKAGVTPIAVGNQYPWVVCHFITSLNAKLVPADVVKANYSLENADFSDPGYAQAFDMMKELYDKGYINNDVNSCTYEMSEAMVVEGKAAMCYDETQILKKYQDGLGDDGWGYFSFPEIDGAKGEKNYITGGPDIFMVNSASEHPDEAIEFLKHLTSKEVQSKICKDIAFLPVVEGAATKDNSMPQTLEIIDKNLSSPGIAEWLDCAMNQTVADEYLVGCQTIFDGTSSTDIMKQISDVAKSEQ